MIDYSPSEEAIFSCYFFTSDETVPYTAFFNSFGGEMPFFSGDN